MSKGGSLDTDTSAPLMSSNLPAQTTTSHQKLPQPHHCLEALTTPAQQNSCSFTFPVNILCYRQGWFHRAMTASKAQSLSQAYQPGSTSLSFGKDPILHTSRLLVLPNQTNPKSCTAAHPAQQRCLLNRNPAEPSWFTEATAARNRHFLL